MRAISALVCALLSAPAMAATDSGIALAKVQAVHGRGTYSIYLPYQTGTKFMTWTEAITAGGSYAEKHAPNCTTLLDASTTRAPGWAVDFNCKPKPEDVIFAVDKVGNIYLNGMRVTCSEVNAFFKRKIPKNKKIPAIPCNGNGFVVPPEEENHAPQ